MKLRVKDMDIATGGGQIVILNQKDAELWDLHHMDRLLVRRGKRRTVAVLDIAESRKAVPPGRIGFFEEVLDALNARHGDIVEISLEKKPASVRYIRKKLDGKELSYEDIYSIVKDIVENKLTTVELTSYVTANYTHGMSNQEILHLTRAMIATGSRLKLKCPKGCPVVDLHSIGGVPGNRITMVVVPIVAAAGLLFPKTSSRAITSPAGTADTMEVLAPVSLKLPKLQRIMNRVGSFITWGGAVNLAPADDKIIKVESPLRIDAEGEMLASIMAKKASVNSTHLVIEIPIGKGTKIESRSRAQHLQWHFQRLGKHLGIKVKVMIADGTEPIGNGIGPVLEARDVLWVLQNDKRGPEDLRRKSLRVAAEILEFTGKGSLKTAQHLLESGHALKQMNRMIRAQGGKPTKPERLKPAKLSRVIRAPRSGKVIEFNNDRIARIARIAGAPKDPRAGMLLHVHKGDRVKKGKPLFTLYAEGNDKLRFALDAWKELGGITVK